MQIIRIKLKLNDYFFGVVINDDGFSWTPYRENMKMSPYSEWISFEEETFNWLWFRFYLSKGQFNRTRYNKQYS